MSATYATTIISSATLAATTAALSRHSRHLGRHRQTGRLLSEALTKTSFFEQELLTHQSAKRRTRTTSTCENENENENANENENYFALVMVVPDS